MTSDFYLIELLIAVCDSLDLLVSGSSDEERYSDEDKGEESGSDHGDEGASAGD